jgi:hypothetical protein
MKLRDLLVCVGLMVPIVLLLVPLRTWWFHAALQDRSFSTTWEWLDLAHLGVWVFEFAWSLLVGGLVAVLVRSKHRVRWALACGALGGLADFLMTRNVFFSVTPWTSYVWAYGTYFVPILGAGLAALVVSRLLPGSGNEVPSAA